MHIELTFTFASLNQAGQLLVHLLDCCDSVDWSRLWNDTECNEAPGAFDPKDVLEYLARPEVTSSDDHLLAIWYFCTLRFGILRISRGSVSLSRVDMDEWKVQVYFCLYRQSYSRNIMAELQKFGLELQMTYDALDARAFSPAGNYEPNSIFRNEEIGPKWKMVEQASPLFFEPWTAPYKVHS